MTPEEATTDPAEGRTSFRVLLVEDSAPIAQIFSLMLEELGHEVCIASNGTAALAALDESTPQVVFSDISMPGMSGYELAKAIRGRPEGAGMFLIAMTGYGQPEDRARALEAGFDEHLVKPATIEQLNALFAKIAARG